MGRRPREEIKQYWKTEEIARLFGFDNVRSIYQLAESGVIELVETTENGHRVKRYDLLPTITAYVKYLRNKASGRERTETEAFLKQQKLRAEVALKESQGELHRLRTDIAAGRYISIEEIKLDYSKFFVTFKKFAMALPARLAGRLTGFVDPVEVRKIEDDLQKEIHGQLTSFATSAHVEGEDGTEETEAPAEKKQRKVSQGATGKRSTTARAKAKKPTTKRKPTEAKKRPTRGKGDGKP